MSEAEKMFSVREILQSNKFQDEAQPKLKFIIRKAQRESQKQESQPTQTTNRTKKVA